MGALERWNGPFSQKAIRDFFEGMRLGQAAHLYREETTASGDRVPDHLGWFQKETNGRLAASTGAYGTRISGNTLNLDEAVSAASEPNPDYIVYEV